MSFHENFKVFPTDALQRTGLFFANKITNQCKIPGELQQKQCSKP